MATAETLILPELKGSAKQIAWATVIRVQAHEEFISSIKAELKEAAERFFFKFSEEHRDTSWWIEDRASYGICTDLKCKFNEFLKEQETKFVCKIEWQGIDVETLTGHHKKFVSVVQKNEQKIKEILSDFIDFDGNGEIVLTEDIKNISSAQAGRKSIFKVNSMVKKTSNVLITETASMDLSLDLILAFKEELN